MNDTVTLFTDVGTGLQASVDYYYQTAVSVMFDDYRFMFASSCMAILVAYQLGKELALATTKKEFFKRSWHLLLFLLVYFQYGLYSIYKLKKVLEGSVL